MNFNFWIGKPCHRFISDIHKWIAFEEWRNDAEKCIILWKFRIAFMALLKRFKRAVKAMRNFRAERWVVGLKQRISSIDWFRILWNLSNRVRLETSKWRIGWRGRMSSFKVIHFVVVNLEWHDFRDPFRTVFLLCSFAHFMTGQLPGWSRSASRVQFS